MTTDLQTPQGQAQANPIAAPDVAVDDDRGDRGLMHAGAAFKSLTKFVVHVDVWRAQVVNRLTQPRFGMRAHFGRQTARIEQHEFGDIGLGRTDQRDEIAQGTTCPQFQCASSLKGLLLKMGKQVGTEGMAATVRPMHNYNTHDTVLVIVARANAPSCNEAP